MTYVNWSIDARAFTNCNCAYGCPCQFNALPSNGHCEAVQAIQIDTGQFGDVSLDGLRTAMIVRWPGPIHEGNGEAQFIIDERADERQREALLKIVSGEETEPGATFWQVFSTTISTVHDPLFRPIEFAVDIDARQARLSVADLIETTGEPIRNPVTGEEHHARINLPNGFEYTIAEMGSGTSKIQAAINLDLRDSYGQFNRIRLTQNGIPK